MKLLLIMPGVGRKENTGYVKTWIMEPLMIAQLASITPNDVEMAFYDDRIEMIPYDEPCDLVGITVETYTARRAYEIGSEFRKRGIPVVFGGYHPTLIPEEAIKYADAVVIGEAEGVWNNVIEDARGGKLKRFYQSDSPSLSGIIPDRSIYKGKNYLPLRLVETARGCPFSCEFCSTGSICKGNIKFRNIKDVINDIRCLKRKLILFTDENIVVDIERARKLFKALVPVKVKWVGQVAPAVLLKKDIISLMRQSGCTGLLIGFESPKEETLKAMKKYINLSVDYGELIYTLHSIGIGIYASFIAGYNNDLEDIYNVFDFLLRKRVTLAGFSPLTPYPGTPLYKRLSRENRIKRRDWWMNEPYPYWKFVYYNKKPDDMKVLEEVLRKVRRKFYSFSGILKRLNLKFLFSNPALFILHIFLNLLGLFEIKSKELIEKDG